MSFSKTQLNRLLNTACELLTSLEDYASAELREDIDAWFDEINENRYVVKECKDWKADMEAQDFDTFGERKI